MYWLCTLGGSAIERDGAAVDRISAHRKSFALLAILAVEGTASRERLMGLLWSESDAERARGSLKQAIHLLRRHLEAPDLLLGTAELRLNPERVETDVRCFSRALGEGDAATAVGLYRGPFLEGFHLDGAPEFERWADAERAELARRHVDALEQLARGAEARGDHAGAAAWWRRLQAEDPLNGRVALSLMRALEASGDLAGALRHARMHEARLGEELGIASDPAVAALADRLRSSGAGRPHGAAYLRDPPRLPPLGSPDPDRDGAESDGAASGGPLRSGTMPGVAPQQARRRPAGLTVTALSGLVALTAAVAAVGWLVADTRGGRENGPAASGTSSSVLEPPSIAVLPFDDMSPDGDAQYFGDGMAEELIKHLSRVEGLAVAGRTSTFALKGRGLSATSIAGTLGVATVLGGSVRREGDRLKVAARLVDGATDAVLWAGAYDREPGDVFAVQEEIANATVAALYRESPLRPPAVVKRPTSDPEAYDLYLRARHSWTLPPRERLERSATYFQHATERDPDFAMAYAGLAETYVNLANFGYVPSSQALARAKVAAGRALELDSTLAEAHVSRGYVLASELEFEAAETAFQRAIALNPRYPWAHHYHSLLLMMLGRTDDAARSNRQALTLDPLSLPANATRGILSLQIGRDAEAEQELQRALDLAPDYALALYYLGALKAVRGEFGEALPLLESAAAVAPDFVGVPGALAFVYGRMGRREEADSMFVVMASREPHNGRMRVNLAFAHAASGRSTAAASLLEQLHWDVPSLIALRADPFLRGLRGEASYGRLLRNIGAADR